MAQAHDVSPTRFERIHAVFSEALERGPETRDAFLTDSCGTDAALRSEVESLLAALNRSGARWDSPALGINIAGAAEQVADPGARAGTFVGPYRLTRLIAQGGMGAVYEGERADEEFHKRVAVKFLRRGADSELAVRRFRRERLILASLEHRNIGALLDGGVLADAQPYFIMEYVEGQPITAYADARRLGIRDRVALARQVCRAIQHAHEHLVVHRDLKPSNILVTEDGTVKLLDFGIAKLLQGETSAEPITQGHERAMTLEYASPEQLHGGAISTASDVYSLGVVLYELLSGHRPFRGEGQAFLETARQIAEVAAPKPSAAVDDEAAGTRSARSLAALRAELHGDLDSIVLMALRKEPRRRYSSAESLSRDLLAWHEGRPVAAGPDRVSYRARKFFSRHRWEAAISGLFAASLMVGSATTYWQATRAQARYRDGRRLANTLVSEVHDAIADLPGATAARAAIMRPALEYLDRTARDVGFDPALDRELAFAYQRIGDVQGNPTNANLGDAQGARRSYDKAMQIAQRVYAATPDEESSARLVALLNERLADVAAPNGDVAAAVMHQRDAIDMYSRIASRWPSADATHKVAVSTQKLADLTGHPAFRNLGDTATAMRLYREALARLESIADTDHDRFRNRRYRALVFERMGRIAQDGHDPLAADLLERSLALRVELAATRPQSVEVQRDVAIAHFLLCGLHFQEGALDRALAACDASFAKRKSLYDADPRNAQLVRGMGLIYRRLGDIESRKGASASASQLYRAGLTYYDTLAIRKAATASDSADREVLRRLLRPSGE